MVGHDLGAFVSDMAVQALLAQRRGQASVGKYRKTAWNGMIGYARLRLIYT